MKRIKHLVDGGKPIDSRYWFVVAWTGAALLVYVSGLPLVFMALFSITISVIAVYNRGLER